MTRAAASESFEAGLRRDIEKRFRQAIGRLANHAVDLEIDVARARKDGDTKRADERESLLYAFERHASFLRMAIGRLVVEGDHYMTRAEKEALAAASKGPPKWEPPKSPKPPKAPAPVITPRSHRLAPVQGTLALPMPRIILDAELEEGT